MGETEFLGRFKDIVEVSEKEQELSRQVNAYVARATGSGQNPNWALFTYIMTAAFFVVTYLVCFFKADFVNITVCALAIFLLQTADQR